MIYTFTCIKIFMWDCENVSKVFKHFSCVSVNVIKYVYIIAICVFTLITATLFATYSHVRLDKVRLGQFG